MYYFLKVFSLFRHPLTTRFPSQKISHRLIFYQVFQKTPKKSAPLSQKISRRLIFYQTPSTSQPTPRIPTNPAPLSYLHNLHQYYHHTQPPLPTTDFLGEACGSLPQTPSPHAQTSGLRADGETATSVWR